MDMFTEVSHLEFFSFALYHIGLLYLGIGLVFITLQVLLSDVPFSRPPHRQHSP